MTSITLIVGATISVIVALVFFMLVGCSFCYFCTMEYHLWEKRNRIKATRTISISKYIINFKSSEYIQEDTITIDDFSNEDQMYEKDEIA